MDQEVPTNPSQKPCPICSKLFDSGLSGMRTKCDDCAEQIRREEAEKQRADKEELKRQLKAKHKREQRKRDRLLGAEAVKQRRELVRSERQQREDEIVRNTPVHAETHSESFYDPANTDNRRFLQDQSNQFMEQVSSEVNLSDVGSDFEDWVTIVNRLVVGFENKFVQRVYEPAGELISYTVFPDVVGAFLEHRVKFYRLDESSSFLEAYRKLLPILDERYGSNNDKHSDAVKRERERLQV